MVKLTIDGRQTEVADGATILDAARSLGVEIPTLCHRPGHGALTSCMVCLVRVEGTARFVPSCATAARDGMVVQSDSEEVHRARRTAIELLLSDHAGDCLAPCTLVCPAHMDIQEMLRLISLRQFAAAAKVIKEHIPLPSTLGRICPDLCEKGCRRAQHDGAVSVCRLKRFVGDWDLAQPAPYMPQKPPATGKRVAIAGAGPAGLSAAWYLLALGHDVTIYDAREKPGGALRYAIDEKKLPRATIDAEVALIEKLGARFVCGTPLVATQGSQSSVTLGELRESYDAVLLALGVSDTAGLRALGLPVSAKGAAVDPVTCMTGVPGVFAAGAVISPYRLAVRAVGDGRTAARAIDAYLAGALKVRRDELFSVRLSVLTPAEISVMLADSLPAPRGHEDILTDDRAVAEAARCLHCGCAGADECALRQQAAHHHADPLHFRGDRRRIAPPTSARTTAGDVVFESGKCISCGKCVAITAQSGQGAGQAYIGRGFDMRVAPPFDATFAEAVAHCAQEVVNACPTAAIRWADSPKCRNPHT